jgi:hypothetical protein
VINRYKTHPSDHCDDSYAVLQLVQAMLAQWLGTAPFMCSPSRYLCGEHGYCTLVLLKHTNNPFQAVSYLASCCSRGGENH